MSNQEGHKHLMSQTVAEINSIFSEIGFVFAEGPEREKISFNFDYLNVPKDHPSRDMQDTFYLEADPELVMRTHTSPVQIRYMQNHQPPIRMICPGKVFRNEATDATHEAQFFQIEGLMIDKNISLRHMKGVLEYFFTKYFGDTVEVRFRPSFFPFVEPGIEVDMKIEANKNNKLSGRWIEIMGAGMVHPNVLRAAGVDPEVYQGFAFGGGIDRLIVLRYGLDDIRLMYNGDLRFVNQF
ncbi:MAG TPA: phenylalanine--tRNA ligase subunit alpha [Candidatus Paceibacterota bacterium]|nr:phenylalanine--tRNA ligase subunit alpha [Candidatus Paceibacterota bacterium]